MSVPVRKKVTSHFKRYKIRYLTGGLCLILVSVTGVTLSKYVRSVGVSVNNAVVEGRNDLSNIARVVGRNGHPGKLLYCNETKQIFRSHREAARELGIDNRDLWAYLKGIRPTAKGFTFKKIGEAI